jgi:hypothetical protein
LPNCWVNCLATQPSAVFWPTFWAFADLHTGLHAANAATALMGSIPFVPQLESWICSSEPRTHAHKAPSSCAPPRHAKLTNNAMQSKPAICSVWTFDGRTKLWNQKNCNEKMRKKKTELINEGIITN